MTRQVTVQAAFVGGVLGPSLWARVDFDKTGVALKQGVNCFVHAQGGISKRAGLEFAVASKASGARLIPFVFNSEQSYVLEFGNKYMRVIKDGGHILDANNNIYEIVTPYEPADLSQLNYAQSNDVLKLVHPKYPVHDLKRTGHAAWSISAVTFRAGIEPPTGVSASGGGSGTVYSYVVTASSEAGEESKASSAASCSRDNISQSNPNNISWQAVSGASKYNVYKLDNGIYGWIGSSETLSFSDTNIKADTADTPPKERTPFNGAGKYPAVVSYHEQRLVLAGWSNKPNGFEMSASGSFNNFSFSSPAKADDAISQAIAARQVQHIRGFVPLKTLLCLTSGGVWEIVMPDVGSTSAPILSVKLQSYFGSSYHSPLIIGSSGLYIGEHGKNIYDVRFDALADSYGGEDVTILASHLFDGECIKEWDFAQAPYSLVFVVMAGGGVRVLTYLKEHKIKAWTNWKTDGNFKSVTVIPENGEDVAYFIVERTINNQSVEYIERLHSRYFATKEEAFFVDCGLSYSGVAIKEVSGLGHLEGRTLVALCDGGVVKNLTVAAGKVTLPHAASKINIGLGFGATIETLPWASEQIQGAGLHSRVNITHIHLMVKDTLGLVLSGYELKHQQSNWGSSPLRTEMLQALWPQTWQGRPTIIIEAPDPLPATLLSISLEVEVA